MRVGRLLYPILAALAAPTALAAEPDVRVSPTALLQTWGTVFDQDEDPQADPAGYGDPEADPGFTVRRARFGFDLAWDRLDARVVFGAGAPYDALTTPDPGINVIDAVAGVTFEGGGSALRLSAGTQKVPVSRELLISSRDLLFQERGVSTNWLAPGWDTGVLADYTAPFGGRARVGVFNGNADLFGDDNGGVLTVGRFEFGSGDTYRTWSADQQDAFGVGVAAMHNLDVATSSLVLSADVLFRFGPVTALLEGTRTQIAPRGDTTIAPPDVQVKTVRVGGLAQVSVFAPLSVGGLDVGARFSLFDDQVSARNNGDVALIDGGVTWRDPIPGLNIGAGWIHRQELAGRALPNDTARLWMQVAYPFHGAPSGPALPDSTD